MLAEICCVPFEYKKGPAVKGLVKVIDMSQMLNEHNHKPAQLRFVEPPFPSTVIFIGFTGHAEQGGTFSKKLTLNITSQGRLLITVIPQLCALEIVVLNMNIQTTASLNILLIFVRFFILVWFLVTTNISHYFYK